MRHITEPFTLRKHADLQHEINELMIAIKLHHIELSEADKGNPESWAKAKASIMIPTWDNVLNILNRSFRALDEQRYNPIKY